MLLEGLPKEMEAAAHGLIAQGVRFEAEILSTGEVSLSTMYDGEQIWIEITGNGPILLLSAQDLITMTHRKINRRPGPTE